MSNRIIWLRDLYDHKASFVGGKALQLGELYRNKFPVPDGFVITTNTFTSFLEKNCILSLIDNFLDSFDYHDTIKLNNIAEEIKNSIISSQLSIKDEKNIYESYRMLDNSVAIRSSATCEDGKASAFAGQFSSFLNIKGDIDTLIKIIKKCYASLFNPNAVAYILKKKYNYKTIKMAIIIQKMVNAKKSGVIFTMNPATNKHGEMIVESAEGLGENLVAGKIIPDYYVINKLNDQIKQKKILKNEILSRYELKDIIDLGKRIENHYRAPQDIEWSIASSIYILQTRHITTMKTIKEDQLWV